MTKAVFCIAINIDQAGVILNRLKSAGFSNNDVSVLLPGKSTSKDFAHEKHSKTPDAWEAGRQGVGVALCLLVGVGSLAIPGVGQFSAAEPIMASLGVVGEFVTATDGPFIAAGPIMASLGIAALGAAGGGLTGALSGAGIPEYEAKHYEGKIQGGGILISVQAANGKAMDQAEEIFEAAHAEDISSTEEFALSA